MNNNVVVTIAGTQDDSDPISLMTSGTYNERGTSVVLEYDDISQGLEGCKSTITFDGELVTMQRKGDAESLMYFAPNRWATSTLRLPEGELELEIFSTRVDYHVAPERGYLDLSYQLKIGGRRAHNHVQVEYKSQS